MALQKTVLNESIRKIILVLIALPLVASSNIDCGGKAFHCVNSTHFMICVDLGGGVSSTIDNFIIPCPPSTVCQGTNHFECEVTRSTTVPSIKESSVPSELRLSETTTVTNPSIIFTTNEIISEVQSTDINLSTVSITTLQEDTVTTNKPVTESVLVDNYSTTHYTNIGYTLVTASNELTTYTNTIDTSNLTTSSTPLYQDTGATLLIDDVAVTTDLNILENITADSTLYSSILSINEIVPDQRTTETFIVNDASSSFTTEKYYEYATSTEESSVTEKELLIANNTINNDLYQITINEVIETTEGTTTTKANIEVTSTDMLITETFTETFTETNHILSNVTPQSLTEVLNIENKTPEVFVTTSTSQGFELITDGIPGKSVTEQYETSPEVLSTNRASDVWNIQTNMAAFYNADTTEFAYFDNSTMQNNDGIENITIIPGTTYDTTNTNAITQEHKSTKSISQNYMTNNNEGIELKATATTTSSIVTAESVNNLNQEKSGFALDGLTITSEITTESNISEDRAASTLVTGPVPKGHFTVSESINEAQTTTSNIESSTISVTSADMSLLTTQTLYNVGTAPSENKILSNSLEVVRTSNVKDLTVSGVNITNTVFTNFDLMKNTTEETSNKSSLMIEGDNIPTQSTEINVKDYTFTESILFDETASTTSSPISSEVTQSAKGTIVVENSAAISKEHKSTESISHNSMTNNNEGIELTTTATTEMTTSLIVTAESVNNLNQEKSGFALDGLTITSEITTESNISEDRAASILVTRPVPISQFTASETNNEAQTTTSNIESSTISVTSADMSPLTTQTLYNDDTAPIENTFLSNSLEVVKTSNVKDLTVSGVNITNTVFTNFDLMKNTTEETLNKSSLLAEGDNIPTQSTGINVNDYRFTESTLFDETTSTTFSHISSEDTQSAKGIIAVENSTAFLNTKIESIIIDTTQKVPQPNTILPSVFDSTKDISNPLLVTESYKITNSFFTFSDISNRLKNNTEVKVQDQFLTTPITDIPTTIIQNVFTTTNSQETTTIPTVKQKGIEGTTDGSTFISTTVINYLDRSYVVENNTKEINILEERNTDNILGNNTIIIHDTVRTLEDSNFLINNNTTTVNTSNSNSYYLVSTGAEEKGAQILTNTDIINQIEYNIATTTSNLNMNIAETDTKEASTIEISPLPSELQTDNVVTNTHESTIISDFSPSTVTETMPIKPVLEPVDAILKIDTERTVDITTPNYTSYSPYVEEATNKLINNYDESVTIKPSLPNEAFTDILDLNNNSTSHQLSSQNNKEFKAITFDTTQTNHQNEFGKKSQQITNYDLSGGILIKSDQNSNDNNKNISDSLSTLSMFTESKADRENVGNLNENFNLTNTRNTDTLIGDVTFDANNQRKDSIIAISTSVNIVGESTTNKIIKTDDNILKTSTSKTEKRDIINNTNQSSYDTTKTALNLNLHFQLNNSYNINKEGNMLNTIKPQPYNINKEENMLNTLKPQPSIVTNEQIITDGNIITFTNSTNKDFERKIDSSPSHVVNSNSQPIIHNINNYHQTDSIQNKQNPIDYSQNNAPQQVLVTENKQDSKSVVSDQKLGRIVETSTNNEVLEGNVFSTDNVTSVTNAGSLNHSTLLGENLGEIGEVSTTNTSNTIVESAYEIKTTSMSNNSSFNQLSALDTNLNKSTTNTFNNSGFIAHFNKLKVASTSKNYSLNHALKLDKDLGHTTKASETSTTNNRHVSFVESQVTSMPNDGSLKQTLILDQKQSQNALAKEKNTVNISSGTITINNTGVASIQEKSKTLVIPNYGSLKHQLTSAGKLVLSTDTNFGGSFIKPEEENKVMEKTHLSFPYESVRNKVENAAEKQKLLFDHSGNTAVYTTQEITTGITTESTVKHSTPYLNTNSANTFDNRQHIIDPFCSARNRGRYADREDCTKFYVCIGRTEPIVGKCPENTVFSEIKKQCTKNKSHCFRGNEFQCLAEGRFSDILKNNAYYICIKRHNSFIRFKFRCQNGFYFNKITIRCTKQLETTNQSSTSVDNSNSEKSVSEGMSSTETKKSKNNSNSKKESKSAEEFECKKEGKFADRDNCRKFFVCTKTKKSEFRMRTKICDSDEVFHKDKKKCVDADSYEC